MKVGDTVILTGTYWRGCEGVITEMPIGKKWLRTDFLDGRRFLISQVRVLDPSEKYPPEIYY